MIRELLVGLILTTGTGEKPYVPAAEVRLGSGSTTAGQATTATAFYQRTEKLEAGGPGHYFGGGLETRWNPVLLGLSVRHTDTPSYNKTVVPVMVGAGGRTVQLRFEYDAAGDEPKTTRLKLRFRVPWRRLEYEGGVYRYRQHGKARLGFSAGLALVVG